MSLPGLPRARRALRRLRETVSPSGVILMYHQVNEVEADPWGLAVSPARFAEHLEILRRAARVISLGGMLGAIRAGRLPRRSVAVTFDDGYADNLHRALPLLEAREIPATLFVTSGFLGRTREPWWSELERILIGPASLPARIEISIEGTDHRWELGDGAAHPEEARRAHRRWRTSEPPPTPRHRLYLELWRMLRPIPDEERQAVLDRLAAWAAVPLEARPSQALLSEDELARLASGALVDIGAHSVTHPPLQELPAGVQEREIRGSRDRLEQIVGRPVESFAYPHGSYGPGTVELVERAGFTSACTTDHRPVQSGADPFRLPRIQVEDWPAETFERQLARWLGRGVFVGAG